jgi:hypothetical protein
MVGHAGAGAGLLLAVSALLSAAPCCIAAARGSLKAARETDQRRHPPAPAAQPTRHLQQDFSWHLDATLALTLYTSPAGRQELLAGDSTQPPGLETLLGKVAISILGNANCYLSAGAGQLQPSQAYVVQWSAEGGRPAAPLVDAALFAEVAGTSEGSALACPSTEFPYNGRRAQSQIAGAAEAVAAGSPFGPLGYVAVPLTIVLRVGADSQASSVSRPGGCVESPASSS